MDKIYKDIEQVVLCGIIKEAKKVESSIIKKAIFSSPDKIEELYKKAFKDTDRWKKYWESLTEGAEHKITKCMEKVKSWVDNPGAFCRALAEKVGYEPQRKKKSSVSDLAIIPTLIEKYGEEMLEEKLKDTVLTSFDNEFTYEEFKQEAEKAIEDFAEDFGVEAVEEVAKSGSIERAIILLSVALKNRSTKLAKQALAKLIENPDFFEVYKELSKARRIESAAYSLTKGIVSTASFRKALKDFVNTEVNIDLTLDKEQMKVVKEILSGYKLPENEKMLEELPDKSIALYVYAQTMNPFGSNPSANESPDVTQEGNVNRADQGGAGGNQTQNIEETDAYKKCIESASGVLDNDYVKNMCRNIVQQSFQSAESTSTQA